MAAPGDPLLDYGVDIVSDYVSRGADQFVIKFAKEDKAHEAFNSAPAVQPYATLHGAGGFWFGLWGSFAASNRQEDEAHKADPTMGFPGLKVLDEIDYTLAWDWGNKLGGFSAGWLVYTYPSGSAGAEEVATNSELYIKYAPAILPALSPTLTHYVVPDGGTTASGATYTTLGIGGGETLKWKLSVGAAVKLKDVAGGISYGFGPFSAALTAAYRPNPELLGPYDKDGKYTLASGEVKDYPKTIAWVTFSYGGSVTE
jgi:hypothetical protein